MKVLTRAVLGFEAVVLFLLIPVVAVTGNLDGRAGFFVGAVPLIFCIAALGTLSRGPIGVALGWATQIAAIAAGFFAVHMFFLGPIFALLWWSALRWGARADALDAQRAQAASSTTPPSSSTDSTDLIDDLDG